MNLKRIQQRLFRSLGYDLVRMTPTNHPLPRRRRLFEHYEIGLVLDVGANTGQFVHEIRNEAGYSGRIVSFEPLPSAYRRLERAAAKDPLWAVHHFGLGDCNKVAELNVAGNSVSSSFLPMLSSHLNAEPTSLYSGTEKAETRTLDSIFNDIWQGESNVFLKIDPQGYEYRIVRGAAKSLRHINTLQLEMSFVMLYEGQVLFCEMVELLGKLGYVMVAVEPGFSDPRSGEMLQIDAVLHRF